MSIKKVYLKSKPVCKTTFRLSKHEAKKADSVTLVGDFNDWNGQDLVMRRLKNGDFTHTINLDVGHSYQFRYLLNNETWENDWHADAYVPNGLSTEDNSVINI